MCIRDSSTSAAKRIEPLFSNDEEYEEFKARHDKAKIKRGKISEAEGPLFLGIDAGSTTTKACLIDKEKRLLYSFYKGNEGNPLETTREMLKQLYDTLPDVYKRQTYNILRGRDYSYR